MPNSRAVPALIFLLSFILTSYFYSPNLSNQNSRLDAIYTVVEDPENPKPFSINKYIFSEDLSQNTIDWSYYQGNYYTNKAPGTTFLGVPAYYFILQIEKIFGDDPNHPIVAHMNAYLINIFVSVLPFCFAMVCIYYLLCMIGCSQKKSIFLTVLFLITTPLYAYNTHLWGNTTAASFIIISLYYLHKEKSNLNSFFSGFFLSLAVSCEYLVGISALCIFIYAICTKRANILVFIGSGIPLLIMTLIYQKICFGSFWTLPQQVNNAVFTDPDLMLSNFGAFSPTIMFKLLFSLEKGLILASPILIACFVGFAYWIKSKKDRALLLLCLLNIVFYIVVNSGFKGWHGGSTVLARYLIPSLVFYWIALAYLPEIKNIFTKLFAVLLISLSTLNMLVLASITPLAPDDQKNPLYGFHYQFFFDQNLSPFKFPIRFQSIEPYWATYKEYASWNVGQLMGLEGFLSLVPLLIGFALVLGLITHKVRISDT